MPRKRGKDTDDRQLELDFSGRVEAVAESTRLIAESAHRPAHGESADRLDEEELHVELAVACKRAMRASGLSREETLEKINEWFGRSDGSDNKPVSIGVFKNWLSKPVENPIPVRIMLGICWITDNLEPFEALLSRFGATVVPRGEQVALLLGKLQTATLEVQRLKKQLTRQLCEGCTD